MSQCPSFDAKKLPAERDITEKLIIDRSREAWMRDQVISNSVATSKKPTIVDADSVPTKSMLAITSTSEVMLQARICRVIAV